MTRQINEAGLELLKMWEGCRLTVYLDVIGYKTVGYGHLCPEMEVGQHISQEMADTLLMADLYQAEHAITHLVTTPLSDNQFSALVCLVYNIGIGNFKISNVRHLLNEGKYESAANHFLLWDRAGGKELDALHERRRSERALFLRVDA